MDEDHVYHATNDLNLHNIADSGHLRTHGPSHGTDQDSWPDGSREKRSYWGNSMGHIAPFHPEDGKPVAIRALRSHVNPKQERGTKDLYTTKKVSSDHLEHNLNGKWEKVSSLKESSLMEKVIQAIYRNILNEEAPTNCMGASSSTSGTGNIDTFDPLLKAKKKAERKTPKIDVMLRKKP